MEWCNYVMTIDEGIPNHKGEGHRQIIEMDRFIHVEFAVARSATGLMCCVVKWSKVIVTGRVVAMATGGRDLSSA